MCMCKNVWIYMCAHVWFCVCKLGHVSFHTWSWTYVFQGPLWMSSNSTPCLSSGFRKGFFIVLHCVNHTSFPARFWGFSYSHLMILNWRSIYHIQLCVNSGGLNSSPPSSPNALPPEPSLQPKYFFYSKALVSLWFKPLLVSILLTSKTVSTLV